ncbi:MAG: hypothetical protein EA370_14990 [Wenzhouxiangella sp.]|nr:MAG: hypothetical protein EA370_14990 [Wenzhouxiangella sp.]
MAVRQGVGERSSGREGERERGREGERGKQWGWLSGLLGIPRINGKMDLLMLPREPDHEYSPRYFCFRPVFGVGRRQLDAVDRLWQWW